MGGARKYLLLWATQSVSQLGSAMTGFAFTLWAYGQTRSALTVSLMSFCSYVPYVLASLAAGAFVDRHSKKAVMLAADSLAALCTLAVLVLCAAGRLQIWHIYAVNAVLGLMNAFQQPASAVAVGKLVPKESLSNVSGLNSFSTNLVTVLAPLLAAAAFAAGGLGVILLLDLLSFSGAFLTLLLAIHIPEEPAPARPAGERLPALAGAREGFAFLSREKGLLALMLTMALINFCSRLTYENVLSPMVLARSGGDSLVLGAVNGVMGLGGIVGGVIVSVKKPARRNARMMYAAAALSFLFGDLLMAVGRGGFAWCAAGLAASLPIPFVMAGNNVLMFSRVPQDMQGRVFSVRNAVQFGTVPFGILLGGLLADRVFEPFMAAGSSLAAALAGLVGAGEGSGMALMFLCTGVVGSLVSLACCASRTINRLDA